jgi:hypothetical protein
MLSKKSGQQKSVYATVVVGVTYVRISSSSSSSSTFSRINHSRSYSGAFMYPGASEKILDNNKGEELIQSK